MNYIIAFVLSFVMGASFILIDKRLNLIKNKRIFYILLFAIFLSVNCIMVLYVDYLLRFVFIYNILLLLLGLLSIWDIQEMKIPVIVVYIFTFFCVIMILVNPYCKVANNVITGGLFSILIFLAYKISRGKIGLGDVKVMCGLAFAFGYPMVFNIIFASLLLSILFGSILIITKKAKIKTEIPFLPFLFLGCILNILNYIS